MRRRTCDPSIWGMRLSMKMIRGRSLQPIPTPNPCQRQTPAAKRPNNHVKRPHTSNKFTSTIESCSSKRTLLHDCLLNMVVHLDTYVEVLTFTKR
ncbi:hypothetical protein MTP99_014640 [Tenebrio molitor]|nr:hypothetical protein MTP99_014640 [Tenebrio molitor]